LQVFRGLDDPNPPLGALPAALQPYLYCLAHPSAKTWMAKFEVQHDLSLAPCYVKPFVPFDLPSATGVDPTVTSLVTLNVSFAPDSSGTPGAHPLNSADTRGLSSADALAKLMGKALVTSPGKSPNRRSSQRKASSKGKAPAKALSFASPPLSPPRAATSPSGKSEEAQIVPPPPGYRPPPRIPASTLARTFNPTQARSAQHPMLSRWSLPIEFEQALQYADAALPADAYLFVPPDDDDAAIPTRFDRKEFPPTVAEKGIHGSLTPRRPSPPGPLDTLPSDTRGHLGAPL